MTPLVESTNKLAILGMYFQVASGQVRQVFKTSDTMDTSSFQGYVKDTFGYVKFSRLRLMHYLLSVTIQNLAAFAIIRGQL